MYVIGHAVLREREKYEVIYLEVYTEDEKSFT